MHGTKFLASLLASLSAAAVVSSAVAVDKVWVDNANQTWTSGANWNPSGQPGTLDTAIFNLGNVTPPYPVLFITSQFQAINAVVDRLRIDSNPITFAGAASTLTIDSLNITETGRALVIGRSVAAPGVSNAALETLLSQLNTVYATLGQDAGSSGTLNVNGGTFNVTGTGATWDLIVGRNGAGTINVNNGSDVTVADHTVLGLYAGSTGAINVVGAGSLWDSDDVLHVGGSGMGTLNVTGTGQIITQSAVLGATAGASGSATIDGSGSNWSSFNGTLYVGDLGTGTLNITSGADLLFDTVAIANGIGSIGNVSVSGAGSVWSNVVGLTVGNAGVGTLNVNTSAQLINAGDFIVGATGDGMLTIATDGDVSNNHGYLGNQNGAIGAVTIDGNGSTWSNNGDAFVGNAGEGALELTGDADGSSVNLYLGHQAGSTGAMTLSGAGTTWSNDAETHVGREGDGTLSIAGGARLNTSPDFPPGATYIAYGRDSTSLATVDGAGSQWQIDNPLYVAYSGHGSLEITNGGWVDSTTLCIIGRDAGATGAVVVDGVDSLFTPDRPVLGDKGVGTLTVTGGGRVTSSGVDASLGDGVGGNGAATIDGAGSQWLHHFDGPITFEIGHSGQATLEVSNGASFRVHNLQFGGETNTSLQIASQSGSTGAVTVDGVGSQLSLSDTANNDGACRIIIGSGGNGTLAVTNGASVANLSNSGGTFGPGGIFVGGGGGSGTLNIAGGSTVATVGNISFGGLAGTGILNITGSGQLVSSTGTFGSTSGGHGAVAIDGAGSSWTMTGNCTIHIGGLTLSNAGAVQAANLIINAGGALHGNGSVMGTVQNNGLVDPGLSIGALDLTNYAQSAGGTLVFEIASASNFDQLLVTSTATLGGTLTVNLIDGFVPSPGASFTIITADDVDGTFGTVNTPSELEIVYTATSVILQIAARPCLADISNDGVVNVIDLLTVINTWGACANPNNCPADINGDDQVNVIDLLAVINGWGPCP